VPWADGQLPDRGAQETDVAYHRLQPGVPPRIARLAVPLFWIALALLLLLDVNPARSLGF
jgi:hypothetical protein